MHSLPGKCRSRDKGEVPRGLTAYRPKPQFMVSAVGFRFRPILLKNAESNFFGVCRGLPSGEIVEYGAIAEVGFCCRSPFSSGSRVFQQHRPAAAGPLFDIANGKKCADGESACHERPLGIA